MDVRVHVPFRPGLMAALERQGINARTIGGCKVVIELPRNDVDEYRLVPEGSGGVLHIYTTERGGKPANGNGMGTVVCDLMGQAIRPYHEPPNDRTKWYPDFWQARFRLEELVEVSARARGNSPAHYSDIMIVHHRISCRGSLATINHETIWHGRADHLPDVHQQFRVATEAAHAKAWCHHCRCTHYVSRS